MMKLDNFINMMTGHFNNKEQFDNMQREGKTYPMYFRMDRCGMTGWTG